MKSLSLLLLAGMIGMSGCGAVRYGYAPELHVCIGFSAQYCDMVFARRGTVDKALIDALQELPPGTVGTIEMTPGTYAMSTNPFAEAK
jgi:hypothetical protein